MKCDQLKTTICLVSMLLLASCGGGANEEKKASLSYSVIFSSTNSTSTVTDTFSPRTEMAGQTMLAAETSTGGGSSPAAASQFLSQATFGPSATSISELAGMSKSDWINAQFTKSQFFHRDHVRFRSGAGAPSHENLFFESFWRLAVRGNDQLRQRVTYALSQIFVVSFVDGNLAVRPMGVADYYDTLGRHAFGNFRNLLEAVALHPAMGIYLGHLRNQKEDGTRVPDENFAREIMQLMSIGLYQMNQDGSVKTIAGKPIETYSHDDVAGLAKVFTGWSWGGPDKRYQRFYGALADRDRDILPMQMYQDYHSTSTKTFLGVSTNGSGEADLKVALDTLFNHPNVGPFIGRQLIQRLVTSNPSPAYISRVAAAFANNGAGVRGDMRAVLRAILLDPEAADAARPKKIREPVLRLANWMRAFNAESTTGHFMMGNLDDPLTRLGQTPMRSPSVFNFYRPSYSPPNTTLSAAHMVAPEMQITGEPSVTGYLNFIQTAISFGIGIGEDIRGNYTAELALTANPAQLVDRVQLLLMGGVMSTTLRNQIISAVTSVHLPAATSTNASVVAAARRSRVYMAIFLTMASPEYLTQR